MDVLIRSSGMFAVAAGVLNVLSALPRRIPEPALPWVRRSADVSALVGLTGIYLFLRESIGTFGLIAFVVSVVGVLMLVGSFRYDVAVTIYALGVLLLAIAGLGTESLPLWIPVSWILAPVLALPGLAIPELGDAFSLMAAIAYGAGFVGAGIVLVSGGS